MEGAPTNFCSAPFRTLTVQLILFLKVPLAEGDWQSIFRSLCREEMGMSASTNPFQINSGTGLIELLYMNVQYFLSCELNNLGAYYKIGLQLKPAFLYTQSKYCGVQRGLQVWNCSLNYLEFSVSEDHLGFAALFFLSLLYSEVVIKAGTRKRKVYQYKTSFFKKDERH